MTDKNFTFTSTSPDSVETMFSWHENPGALERLTPPWMVLSDIRKKGGIEKGATVKMNMAPAAMPFPLSIPMAAEHLAYEKNRFFRDKLTRGPFKKWEHSHFFTPCGNNLSRLKDSVNYTLPLHIPKKWHHLAENELNRLFSYRHRIMLADLERHRNFKNHQKQPLTILISGASGPVGNALIPFLTTGGHRVIKLVRKKPENRDEIQWNPYMGELDLKIPSPENPYEKSRSKKTDRETTDNKATNIDKIDVVINLNGYHIGSGRWTKKTKDIIVKSRNLSTSLISERIRQLPIEKRPELFISASATGFYGDCGDSCVNENSCCGELFISKVCDEWESCAKGTEDAGIRTVFARMGVVLTPAGGALERLLPGFLMGLGAKIGTGNQYMSWISMDDLVYSLYHIMYKKNIRGAVNLVCPSPVTNAEFTQVLGKVLSRKAPFTLPESLITLLWGKMGEEVLLASTRALPDELLDSGFRFSYPELEEALRHMLGRFRPHV
ncbi:NAD-dependent epimerase/dehydratase family protein [Desulfamplus magnetovallimortis]|uniref:NAD-dependent epimerase/dehydratase family protein n=1 Tax=Desulfamplus magnetovallimortis TaxID=1246637 RepID=A0A1W1H834_9BACT|nr:TIGR01777 family oxidoreductase [Desulfamplus magnetovallimortis]SLM28594.1 NAD-dependent epimerase/dehydratase family protein [Desulfamplus magnetovallimortis]